MTQAIEDALTQIKSAIEPIIRAAADNMYERILVTTQDYLVDNGSFNISSRLEAAERARRNQWDRAKQAEAREIEILTAAIAVLAFYDNLGRDHKPGEARVLDLLASAVTKATQPLD